MKIIKKIKIEKFEEIHYWIIVSIFLAIFPILYSFIGSNIYIALVISPFSFLPIIITIALAGSKKDIKFKLWQKYSFFYSLVDKFKNYIEKKLISAQILKDPLIETQSFCLDIFISLLYIPTIIIYSIHEMVYLLSSLVLSIPYIKLYVNILDKIRERKERTDSELPFFTTFMSILARAGLTPYYAFMKIIKLKEVFSQLSKDAKFIAKDTYLGYGILESLEKNASYHPSEDFKKLIYSTTSVWRSGGDLATSLENRVEEFLKILEDKWQSFSEQAGTLGDFLAILFLIAPAGITSLGIVFPSMAIMMLYIIAIIVIPILLFFSLLLIKGIMPRTYDIYDFNIKDLIKWILSSIIIGFISILIGLDRPIILALSIIAPCLLIQYDMHEKVNEVKCAENVLQRFVRDVSEYRKMGYSITEAIKRCSKIKYNKIFDKFLKEVSKDLEINPSIYEAGKKHRSWLVRIIFFLLNEIEESGGGSVYLLEKVIEMIRRYEISKRISISRLRIYLLLAIFSPIIIIFASAIMVALLTGAGLEALKVGVVTFASKREIEAVISVNNILAIESGACYSLLISRIEDGHVFTTYRIILTTIIGLITFLMFPFMVEQMKEFFAIGGRVGEVHFP
ncbi:MAG: type II secretion system F family protein [Candidatus Methanomethylicaceae archaeon]